MESAEIQNINFLPCTDAQEQDRLAGDILSQIFSYCDTRSLAALARTCRAYYSELNERLWKELVIGSFPCPQSLRLTGWKGLFQSHVLAAKNLEEGKHTRIDTQWSNVHAMFPYGAREGETSHFVLHFRDKLVSWDLETNASRLLCRLPPKHRLIHSRLIWRSSSGSPTKAPWLFLHEPIYRPTIYNWLCINLHHPTQCLRGTEKKDSPKQLTDAYKSIPVGDRPSVWTATSWSQDRGQPLTLIHAEVGDPYWMEQRGITLVAARADQSHSLPGSTIMDPDQLRVIQARDHQPGYLVLGKEGVVHAWNTSTWEKQSLTVTRDPRDTTIEICHGHSPDHALIAARNKDSSTLHMIELNRATGELTIKQTTEAPFAFSSISSHRLLDKDLYVGFSACVKSSGPARSMQQLGSVLVWQGDKTTLWKWDDVCGAFLCYPQGKPALAIREGAKLILADLTTAADALTPLTTNVDVIAVDPKTGKTTNVPQFTPDHPPPGPQTRHLKIITSAITLLAAALLFRKRLPFLSGRPALSHILTLTLLIGSNALIWRQRAS